MERTVKGPEFVIWVVVIGILFGLWLWYTLRANR